MIGDRARLTADLAIFSLIGLLIRHEFDWQLSEVIFEGDVFGKVIQFARVSQPNECREITESQLAEALGAAGNVFAGAPISRGDGVVCLPPDGNVRVGVSELALLTPICQVSFVARDSGSVSNRVPGRSGGVEELPGSRGSRFETRLVGIDVELTRFALRANHLNAEKHAAWCQRVANNAREWFKRAEPGPADEASVIGL